MYIIKRSGKKEQFNPNKIKDAIKAAFNSLGYSVDDDVYNEIVNSVKVWDEMGIEDIQDQIIETLRNLDYNEVADCYQTYRLEHKQARFIRERIDYMDNYANTDTNASTASETDANANVTMKNVANLEGEVYKVTNRRIQRQRMKDKLNQLSNNLKINTQKNIIHNPKLGKKENIYLSSIKTLLYGSISLSING